MKVVTDSGSFKSLRPLVVALGNFDGVHKGHQEIFRVAKERANAISGNAGVLTFERHPQHVLHADGKPILLTSFYQKLSLLSDTKIDLCFVLQFTEEFSKKSPEQFVQEIIINKLGVQSIVMGFNARFGNARTGDSHAMKKMAAALKFDFFEVGPVEIEDVSISSTLIRKLVEEGHFEQAERFLGRPYSFYGIVVNGNGRGKRLGYPTANLNPQSEVLPPRGVYAVWVNIIEDQISEKTAQGYRHTKRIVQESLLGALNYGVRPTFGGAEKPVMEVHLLDWQGELRGKTLEIRLVKKIRDEKRFSDEQSLIAQIKDDVRVVRESLKPFQSAADSGSSMIANAVSAGSY